MPEIILTKKQKKLKGVFELFLEYWGLGLLPFYDDCYEFPDAEEINEMLNAKYGKNKTQETLGVRVQGGDNIPLEQRIVENSDTILETLRENGGISLIRKALKEYSRKHKEQAYIIVELSKNKEKDRVEKTSEKFNIDKQTVTNRKNKFLKHVSIKICTAAQDLKSKETDIQ